MEGTTVKVLARYDFERYDIVQLAKSVAEPYLEKGQARNGFQTFVKVMKEHAATSHDSEVLAGLMQWFNGDMETVEQVREFINRVEN